MTLEKEWKHPSSAMVLGGLEGLLEQISISQKNKKVLIVLFMGPPKTISLSWTWLWQDACADLDKGSSRRQGELLVSNHGPMACLLELPWGLWLKPVCCWVAVRLAVVQAANLSKKVLPSFALLIGSSSEKLYPPIHGHSCASSCCSGWFCQEYLGLNEKKKKENKTIVQVFELTGLTYLQESWKSEKLSSEDEWWRIVWE